jgi:hypothetical protein
MNTNLGRGNFNRKERRDPKDQRDAMTLIDAQVAGQWRTAFSYDGLNRRRIMKNYSWSGSGWVQTNEMRLIYDGLKIIQERDTNNAVLVTYTRGNDMSGTLKGAGGIGGLLARTDTSGTDYYHADGSGNVTALMNTSQHIVGRYLYGPFGRLIGQWGAKSGGNVMRFSSKPYLALTDDYDFGFRRYRPDLQRWLNRDPIGEAGGINLYVYVGNDPINYVDSLGLDVTYIVNSSGAQGNGHAGEIVGQPGGDNFTYHSFSPEHPGWPSDKGKYDQQGFKSYEDALNYAKKHGYNKYAKYKCDAGNDQAARDAAKKFSGTDYNVGSHNCQDMVNCSMNAAGLDFQGTSWPNYNYNKSKWTADEFGKIK